MGDTAQVFVFLPFPFSFGKRLIIVVLVSAATAVLTQLFFTDFYGRHATLEEMTGMAGGMAFLLITVMFAGPKLQQCHGVQKITVDDAGFALVSSRQTITIAWTELTAAHFRVYDAGAFQVPAFIYLTRSYKKEISLLRMPDDRIKIFQATVEKCLKDHEIPETAPRLSRPEKIYSRILICLLFLTGLGMILYFIFSTLWLIAAMLFCAVAAMVVLNCLL